jgi:hypothetical protein
METTWKIIWPGTSPLLNNNFQKDALETCGSFKEFTCPFLLFSEPSRQIGGLFFAGEVLLN